MPQSPTGSKTSIPCLSQMREPISLEKIRKLRESIKRGGKILEFENASVELETYFNQTLFDLSVRVGDVERFLKNEARMETAPLEILEQLEEILMELRFCSYIGNFAIRQQASYD